MSSVSYTSACVIVATLVANIATVTCDYDMNEGLSFGTKNSDAGGLCNGVRCPQISNGMSGAIWFGPRLGRKRRSDEKIETTDEDISAIADAINGGPWSFVAYPGAGDKRHTTQFTPRLGRELADDLMESYLGYDFETNRLPRLVDNLIPDNLDPRQVPPPPPPPRFAPRLGRHMGYNPSPRLGRHLRFERKA